MQIYDMKARITYPGFLFMQRNGFEIGRKRVTLTCERTGQQFEYCGAGRRPKYAPGARREIQRERNAAAYQRRKEETNKPRAV